MSSSNELRRIWGADYDKRLDDARDAFDAMSPEMQSRVDQWDAGQVRALSDMRSSAYLDKKHPEHAAASQRVGALYSQITGDDLPIL